MTVSLGMHTQGDGKTLKNDAQQTRRITRVVYHKDYNAKTLVSIASRFFAMLIFIRVFDYIASYIVKALFSHLKLIYTVKTFHDFFVVVAPKN
jgi:hypothetical protein